MTQHLFQIGMDETNKRINDMVAKGLEKAGLAADTKLSGGFSHFDNAPCLTISLSTYLDLADF